MRRRDFITFIGGAVAPWPLPARAQQPSIPVVGLIRSTRAAGFNNLVVALREGLKETGFVEGTNVVIEQRWADDQVDRLPGLAADLVRHKAAVIVGNHPTVKMLMAATPNTPIVFVTGEDPVSAGFVASLGRPGGNVTGITFFGGTQLNSKRMELLHELVPKATTIAVLGDPSFPAFDVALPELVAAARSMGLQTVVVRATRAAELEPAFTRFIQASAGALLVSGSPFLTSERNTIVALAARHALPAIYDVRDMVAAGGLISYSSSFPGAYHQAGVYAGRILKGAKPSELPVQQPTKFELIISLKTAKALGLVVPRAMQLSADELIE